MGKASRNREYRKKIEGQSVATKKSRMNPFLKKALNWLLIIAIAGASIAILVVGTMTQNGSFLRMSDAVTIGGETYKADQVAFYYNMLVNRYKESSYQSLMTYGYDIYGINYSRSLFKQVRDRETGQTWGDFLLDQAIENFRGYVLMTTEAKKNGFELDDEAKGEVLAAIEQLNLMAEANSVTPLAFLKSTYGNAIRLDDYQKFVEREILSGHYSTNLYNSFNFTKEQIDEKYSGEKNAFDVVTYHAFTMEVELPEHLDAEGNEISNDTTKAEDEAIITKALVELKEKLALIKSEADYNKLAEESTRKTDKDGKETEGLSPEETLKKRIAFSVLGEDEAKFLFDADNKAGDTEIVQDKNKFTVYYFINRDDNSILTRDVRHILITIEEVEDEDEASLNAEKAAATAKEILERWQNGDKTEASFAELAKEFSEDTGSAKDGGLVEKVGPGMTVEEFEDWVFEEEREEGDAAIVKTQFGYHIIYYIGQSVPYRDALVEEALRDTAYEALIDTIKKDYPVLRIESGLSKIK